MTNYLTCATIKIGDGMNNLYNYNYNVLPDEKTPSEKIKDLTKVKDRNKDIIEISKYFFNLAKYVLIGALSIFALSIIGISHLFNFSASFVTLSLYIGGFSSLGAFGALMATSEKIADIIKENKIIDGKINELKKKTHDIENKNDLEKPNTKTEENKEIHNSMVDEKPSPSFKHDESKGSEISTFDYSDYEPGDFESEEEHQEFINQHKHKR